MVTNLSLPHSYCASIEIELKNSFKSNTQGRAGRMPALTVIVLQGDLSLTTHSLPTAQRAGIFLKKVLDSKSESI